MEKENCVIIFLVLFLMSSCVGQDSKTPQVSKNKYESQKNGLFLREYNVKKQISNVVVSQAWVEKRRLYNSNATKVVVDSQHCQLCFIVEQVSGSQFMADNYAHWIMQDNKSENRVGLRLTKENGRQNLVYNLEIDDGRCNLFDTIVLDLIHIEFGEFENKQYKVGNIIFIPSSL